jgi:two-component system chemotaxis response regulator CheB
MAPGFISTMVQWLRPRCALPIQVADRGLPRLEPGIHIAPTGHHLVVRNRALHLTDDPPHGGHRPSATVLFRSAAEDFGSAAVGVLFTGMGSDGAAGMGALKRRGAITIAQDEATSVVFGMPGSAISQGVVDYVLPPPQIASLLVELADPARGA